MPVKTFLDQLDAGQEVEQWIQQQIALHGLQSKPGTALRYDNLECGDGVVVSLWSDNNPIATAIVLRDDFNRSVVCCNEQR